MKLTVDSLTDKATGCQVPIRPRLWRVPVVGIAVEIDSIRNAANWFAILGDGQRRRVDSVAQLLDWIRATNCELPTPHEVGK